MDNPHDVNPVTLGLLYELLVKLGMERDLGLYWKNVIGHLRWVLQYERMLHIVYDQDLFVVQGIYEKGKEIKNVKEIIDSAVRESLSVALKVKKLKWVSNPRDKYKSLLDSNEGLISWLLEPELVEKVLIIPLADKDKNYGIIFCSLKEVSAEDRILLSTIISIYTSYAVKNYELLNELNNKKKREEALLRSESVKEKLRSLNNSLEVLNDKLEKKVDTFKKFVPSEFLQALGIDKEIDHVELGYSKARTITVLFSDIRSFTQLSQYKDSQSVFSFINEYLRNISPAITENGGFIDKFIGDAIMAIFINPYDAVMAGIEMMKRLKLYNKKRVKENLSPINIGIGINTGESSMGTIGFENRLETTVLGNTVNIASRLEHLTKRYDTGIIISESTADAIKEYKDINLRFIDSTSVRGVFKKVRIYEVLNYMPKNTQLIKKKIGKLAQENIQKFDALTQDLGVLNQKFEKLLEICPQDKSLKAYIEKIRQII